MLQLSDQVKDLLSKLEKPEIFTGRILCMSMFNDISCGTKDNEEECLAHAKVVSILAKRFGTRQWSFIGPSSEKKWYSKKEDSPQGIWDHIEEKDVVGIRRKRMSDFPCYDPIVQRSTQKQRTLKTDDSLCCHSGNN